MPPPVRYAAPTCTGCHPGAGRGPSWIAFQSAARGDRRQTSRWVPAGVYPRARSDPGAGM